MSPECCLPRPHPGKMWLAEAGECMAGMPRFDCSSEPDLAKLVITELTPKFPEQTRRAVLTVQSIGFGDVEAAARRVAEGIARECGGISRIVVADRRAPVREF
jgi:hypothetical protein